LSESVVSVLQDAEGHAQLFRQQRVDVVQVERAPGARQVVEFAARDRFLDLPLSQE
jgi:hypothetical protein